MDNILDKVEEMLKNPEKLRSNELEWVKKIDKTTSEFRNIEFTPRQRDVLSEIYKRFKDRR